MSDVHPNVRDLWGQGHDVAEIAHLLALTRFQVRAEVNKLTPPARGAPLIPPSGRDSYEANDTPEARKARRQRSKDIVASLIRTTREKYPQRGSTA